MSVLTATIASSGTTSGAIALDGPVAHISLPAAFSGTSLALQTSLDGATYQQVYDSAGNAVSFTVAQGHDLYIDPSYTAGVGYLKLVASAQGAARTILLGTVV